MIRLLPEDRGMVGAFNDKIQFPIATFTSDRDELAAAMKELGFGNPTRLYDAIEASIQQLKDVQGRRVVLVFTDGDDTASKIGMGKVLDQARADEVMIYAIGLESEFFNGQYQVRTKPDRGLRKLSDETGGGYFELKKTDDLGPTFTRVAQELHSQYVLGFPPATDGKLHKLEVRVKKLGMTARARKSYLAPTSGTAVAQTGTDRWVTRATRAYANAMTTIIAASSRPVTSSALPENVQSKRFMIAFLSCVHLGIR